MKVLLSVFECNPYRGSDSYVGWSYVLNVAQHNDVYALTRTENKEDIEEFFCNHSIPCVGNIHFIYVDRSKFFAECLYRVNRQLGFLGSYFVWQKAAYKAAKKLCSEHDISICHHISIADFRCAGYLWKLKIPFIFGPVGGGQETPKCLSEYTKKHKFSELFRSFMNRLTTTMPGYKKALRHAALIYSSNDETTACMLSRMKSENIDKLKQMTELCIDDQYLKERETLQKGLYDDVVHIIVSGRLIYRKGVVLLIDSLKYLQTDVPYVVDIFGEGNQQGLLKNQVKDFGLEEHVVFHGRVPFDQMQQRYKDADIYVLPSLRETTGTAVFEAMANKLPVVALNQNGVRHIVEEDAGILVDIKSKEQILNDFAIALKLLIEDRPLRLKLGKNGYLKLKEHYTWTCRAEEFNKLYHSFL